MSTSNFINASHLQEWMRCHDLTHETAADALGIARRSLNYYLSGKKPIPLKVGLARIGWEVEQGLRTIN